MRSRAILCNTDAHTGDRSMLHTTMLVLRHFDSLFYFVIGIFVIDSYLLSFFVCHLGMCV